MKRRKEIRINSTMEELYLVEQFVEQISDEYLLHDSYFGNIMIALIEAVKNAIQHGNENDVSKKVHIMLEAKREGLWISVIDQGPGFDYQRYTEDYDFLSGDIQEHRGIALIKSLADEVKFQNKGRVIEMLFRITGIDKGVMEERLNNMYKYMRVTKPAPQS